MYIYMIYVLYMCIYNVYIHTFIYIYNTALQINIIPLPVTMNRKIKKTNSQTEFWRSQ